MKDETLGKLTVFIFGAAAVAIITGAVVIYRKYQFTTDVMTYSAIVAVVLYVAFRIISSVLESIQNMFTVSTDTSHDYSYGSEEETSDDNEAASLEFRKPVGLIPDPIDPEHYFTDIYGHQYLKMYGVWHDDNYNICPDYLKDMYGITDYEEKYGNHDKW